MNKIKKIFALGGDLLLWCFNHRDAIKWLRELLGL